MLSTNVRAGEACDFTTTCDTANVCEGAAGVHPRGVQRGVQKWPFVRATRGVRNPKIVHPQFLPATKLNV